MGYHGWGAQLPVNNGRRQSSNRVKAPLLLWLLQGGPQPQLSAVRTSAESGVPGLVLLPGFVSEQEEAALLALVDSRPWQALAKRRVQHYGYTFHYEVGLVGWAH